MRASRVVALIVGSLFGVVAVVLVLSSIVFGVAYLTQRDDGYLHATLDRMVTTTPAITTEQIDLGTDPGTPRWVVDALDTDVRLQVTAADPDDEVFVGIAPEADLEAYLDGVATDEIDNIDRLEADFRPRAGDDVAEPPVDQGIWEAAAAGPGTQELVWEPQSGQWAVAVMNPDGSAGVSVDVDVGVRSDAFAIAIVVLLLLGLGLLVASVLLIVFGRAALERDPTTTEPAMQADREPAAGLEPVSPVSLEARLDPDLSNWRWLVKWLLAIPHLLVLAVLWMAFMVLTFVAGIAILITGRYPRGLFDVNVGVLRWSWRVSYYAFSGGLGTDRYPPFSLGREPRYPATFDVAYPGELSRGLVLIKWWLLAIPHYVVVAVLAGGGLGWGTDDTWFSWGPTGGGLLGILTLIAAVILLFTGRYPDRLFDLIIGLNRWVYRVVAYAALMTDRYPPFRLDQGGAEPSRDPSPGAPSAPSTDRLAATDAEPEPEATAGPVDLAPPVGAGGTTTG